MAGSTLDLPIVDADFMGRAFPEVQMATCFIYPECHYTPSPVVMVDTSFHTATFTNLKTPRDFERFSRSTVITMGCVATISFAPLTGKQVKKFAVCHSQSKAWQIGQRVRHSRQSEMNSLQSVGKTPIQTIVDYGARLLFCGTIVDVKRSTEGGFNRGHLIFRGFDNFQGNFMRVNFQNENLIARLCETDNPLEEGQVVCVVPDLISVLDVESGGAILTEETRYGQRVAVIGLPADDKLKTDVALKVVGPKAFGYHDVVYNPIQ
eukprot:gb/GECH01014243.1/.p1 GENE.gb/GECH01014243.1/~~gb/GECH01014243.1/.p1  ORF type:complete len:264 (+),score=59.93 gb/GECH01014243.1/:1-792(+)